MNKLFENLTELERQQVFKILREMQNGNSDTISKITNDIWDEIPVSIDNLIDDEK